MILHGDGATVDDPENGRAHLGFQVTARAGRVELHAAGEDPHGVGHQCLGASSRRRDALTVSGSPPDRFILNHDVTSRWTVSSSSIAAAPSIARLRWNGLEILDPAVRGAAAAGRDVELRQEPRGDVTDGRESEDRGLLLGVGANVP
jgi:hypothetical protein